MRRDQLLKILKVTIVSTIIILIAEGIFDIPAISNWFSNLITSSSGIAFWITIWIIMFLQVTVLNIPAYVILNACAKIGVKTLSFQYIAVVLSAYMVGCLLAYWLGWKFGKKAVKWCAGSDEDYDKWSAVLNKKGKIWYFLTVLFPLFPDDLLCLVAGAINFDFGWYTLANFVGRGIGLTTMVAVIKLIDFASGGFPILLIVWALALIAEIVIYYVVKAKYKTNEIEQTDDKNKQEAENSNTQNDDNKNDGETVLEKNDKKNINNQGNL